MSKGIFGTDGIRGRAGEGHLSRESVTRLGKVLGHLLKKYPTRFKNRRAKDAPTGNAATANVIGKGKVLIGRDTRESGGVIESHLIEGLSLFGVETVVVGIVPTPAVSWLTRTWGCALGVAISASHNPADDNGIKLISPEGFKVPDEAERMVESVYLDAAFDPKIMKNSKKKALVDDESPRAFDYLDGIREDGLSLKGLHIVVDCANGAMFELAPPFFRRLGAEVAVINDKPNGRNINRDCGALHLESLSEAVKTRGADGGVAFDGDGDRALFVDETGAVRDGDYILAMSAEWMKERNELGGDTVVSTVMANLGLEHYLNRLGLNLVRTAVGDRYVVEEMVRRKAMLGGEQSGHIIFLQHSPTGDGLVTAQRVFGVAVARACKLSSLAAGLEKYPQLLVNIPVRDKIPFEEIPDVSNAVRSAEGVLAGKGRILLRYSGTEPLARVMAEGADAAVVKTAVEGVAECVRKTLGA